MSVFQSVDPESSADEPDNPELFEIKQKWDRTGLDISYLLSQTAKDSKSVVAFNYGSLLLNNSYFLEGLVRLSHVSEKAHY